MKLCDACHREYSDAAEQCDTCGANLSVKAPSQPTAFIKSVACLRLIQAYSGKEILLYRAGEFTIGRADGGVAPDIDLTPYMLGATPSVSRQHARIIVQGNGASLMDLNSTNGTIVNGKLLPPNTPLPLEDGDTVEFGKVSFIFRSS